MSWIWKLGFFFVAIGVVKLVIALVAKKGQERKNCEVSDISKNEMLE